MSTDILAAAIPTPTDADCLDLGALLAPLSRDDVELMLVKLLHKHPQEANWIVQAARKPVDTLEITNEVKSCVNTATSITGCCDELETHIARSSDFLRGGHARNAIAVLEVVTPPTVAWLVEQGNVDELDDEDKNCVQGFTALLENAWQSALDQCKIVVSPAGTAPVSVAEKTTLSRTSGAEKQARQRAGRLPYTTLSTAELASELALLQAHMAKLKPIMGAIFSDPIRLLNKRVKAAQAAAAAAPAEAAAASASSATPAAPAAAAAAGTKRKADADAPADEQAAKADNEAPPSSSAAAAAAPQEAASASAPSKPAAASKPAAKKAKKAASAV